MQRRPCEFFLVRYVPDPIRGEFVNVGVLLRDAGGGAAHVRFTRDWARVRCADPDVDVEMLEALEQEIERRLAEHREDMPYVMKTLEDSLSNGLQITEAKACLAESLPAELEQLMRLYVEPHKREPASRVSGRQRVARAMRREFERAGVWNLMSKRIAAAQYTQPGDSLRLDCGYRPNGVIKMFHAVSLDGDMDLAKVLAYSMPRLREGVTRIERATLELTAIVEPVRELKSTEEDDIAQYRFGVETMESAAIRVLTTSDLERVAEAARRELHL
ncbi:MAG: DUF3037 domain-containing protein [Acidobacteria bacterium]|jgi:hypothetical protein|nr:DUF3037 domain-containing protein [Acidobacteriota bacterium]